MKKLMTTLFSLVIMAAMTQNADAIILSGTLSGGSASTNGGTFQNINGFSGSVGNNTFQNNNLYGFDEDQNILLGSALAADVGMTSIAANTVVASHYIFFDPGPSRRAIGSVLFDAPILAIITSTGNLAASDFLINNSVTYLNPSLRGLESNDSVSINAGNLFQMDLDWRASTPGDYVRVITEASPGANAVPEPASMIIVRKRGLLGTAIRKKFKKS